jgi:hypothetical protein
MRPSALAIGICVALSALAVACADPEPGSSDQPAPADRYEVDATVLDAGSGPELCLGAIAESLPPQCGGMPVLHWSWAEVAGEQHAGGVTWGEYHLEGTYDGSSFTVGNVGPYRIPDGSDGDPFRTPCPEPAGGWVDVDPSLTGDSDRIAAMRVAEAIPDYAGLWIDHLQEPVGYEVPGPFVLNVAFIGEADRFEDELRAVWGGPLCLSRFDHRFRDLRRVQVELSDGGAAELGLELLWSSVDVMGNQVEIGAVVIDAEGQAALDAEYGAGVVRVVPALRPV